MHFVAPAAELRKLAGTGYLGVVDGREAGVAFKRRRFAGRRRAVGFTQEGLAEALGVERTTVARWETAETEPQPSVRPMLAGLLKVTLEELDELLSDVTEVTDDDHPLVVSRVPLDFTLASGRTVSVIEGFSAHDIASRRQMLAALSVLGGAALVRPVRQWAASLPVHGAGGSEKAPRPDVRGGRDAGAGAVAAAAHRRNHARAAFGRPPRGAGHAHRAARRGACQGRLPEVGLGAPGNEAQPAAGSTGVRGDDQKQRSAPWRPPSVT
jgi:transcriptional regulator with XRE-family HTH domain